MTGTRRLLARIAIAVAAVLVLWHGLAYWSLSNHALPDIAGLSPFHSADDSLDTITLDFVRRADKDQSLGLKSKLHYTRRCFTPIKESAIGRLDIEHIDTTLLATNPIAVKLRQRGPVTKEPCTTIPISMLDPYPRATYHDLAFGMATTYSRLLDALDTIAHWASGSESLLVVLVEDFHPRGDDQMAALHDKYHARAINAVFIPPYAPEHSMTQSHFMVLSAMVDQTGPETKWFGLLDDDTFFPHLAPLSATLGVHNHQRDMYVGAVTEHWGSLSEVGFMGFGGAGVYLSAHLARRLGTAEAARKCIDESKPEHSGDYIIMQCVWHHSNARLTILPDLYQHDMVGSLRGFFESGTQPLNLHHWKSWYHEPVLELAKTVRFCGECFLQRYTFGTDTVLSNGYSIGVYADGLASLDLAAMERTFNNKFNVDDPTFDYTMGPTRERLPDDKRKTYHLKYTEVVESGEEEAGSFMRQLYVRKGSGEEEKDEPDEVVELVWRR
ncbi:hypothetical protein Micbo1qcDRAFT_177502 [Microdochium bolleyi]|uniref:Glycosyltransferase family 31 protein n=1 Tax=Microdochium bolleyi TaxID=196109 RepID=A0A136IVE4_9PEZI|nr:hypothetical protein Micbo1qcDRAFT_177502 [Microdochium bolleyi]